MLQQEKRMLLQYTDLYTDLAFLTKHPYKCLTERKININAKIQFIYQIFVKPKSVLHTVWLHIIVFNNCYNCMKERLCIWIYYMCISNIDILVKESVKHTCPHPAQQHCWFQINFQLLINFLIKKTLKTLYSIQKWHHLSITLHLYKLFMYKCLALTYRIRSTTIFTTKLYNDWYLIYY